MAEGAHIGQHALVDTTRWSDWWDGRSTTWWARVTAGLLVIALVFGALYVGVIAAAFVLLGTASAALTVWTWNRGGRSTSTREVVAVVLAAFVVAVVAGVGVARYT